MKAAVHSLLKSPGFTAVTALTLALGIGANLGRKVGVVNESFASE